VVFDSAAIAALDAVAALSGGGPEPQRGMSGAAANHPTLCAKWGNELFIKSKWFRLALNAV
jgi:hypothetical protein